MPEPKTYYAFISYKREDEKWAKWLQRKLEHYKFPTNLNGRTDLPPNIRPTFRDVTDLNPGLLAEEINNALCNSQWLIVICSPRSAKSPWVCKEAQTFIDLGRADHIIPFVIEGVPFSRDIATECYPEALLKLTGSQELLAANINEMGRDAAAIKVVACMFNLRFDTLWQRHERERRIRHVMIFIGFLIIVCTSLIIAFSFRRQNIMISLKNNQIKQINDSLSILNNNLTGTNQRLLSTILEFHTERLKFFISDGQSLDAFFLCRNIADNYFHLLSIDSKRNISILYRESIHQLFQKGVIPIHKITIKKSLEDEDMDSAFSPDQSIKAWLGDFEIIVEDNRTKEVIYSKEHESLCGFYVPGLSGVSAISVNNNYIIARGISRYYSSLSFIDIKKDFIKVLSESFGDKKLGFCIGRFSNDNKFLALSGGGDGIKILSLPDFHEVYRLECTDLSCDFVENNQQLIIHPNNSKEGFVFSRERKTNRIIQTIKETSQIYDAAISPDNMTIAVMTREGLHLWDIHDKRLKLDIPIVCRDLNMRVVYSNDGRKIAFSDAQSLKILDLKRAEFYSVDLSDFGGCCEADRYKSFEIMFSPDNQYIGFWHACSSCGVYSIQDDCVIARWKGVASLSFINDEEIRIDDKVYSYDGKQQENASISPQGRLIGSKSYVSDSPYIIAKLNNDSSMAIIAYIDNIIELIPISEIHDWSLLHYDFFNNYKD